MMTPLNPYSPVSSSFRKQVSKVITAIFLFMIVYLLLIIAAIGLAIVCFYLGGALIILKPMFLTIIIGLGLMGVGVSVIVFLVKFIFAVSKDENNSRVEITEEDQPKLFASVRQLALETGTPMPRKIYVSPDTNACVFYNSGFWSMFFPVRKNLEIGLGLVNSVNISEFKAVMAHEFGHFSQRSMKLGSFTYNVNKVIHNMLYENTGYTAFLNSWGDIHSYMRFFIAITVKIAVGIQWILRGMYKFINKNYMGLSREMEFHADAVAAGVCGGNNLLSALSRTEIAGNCFALTIDKANELFRQGIVFTNIFYNQLVVFRMLADEHQLPVRQGLPEISYQFIQAFSKSRINYKNQWASHPTLKERKEKLEQLGINAQPDESSAWLLFVQAEQLQEQLTRGLYRSVEVKETIAPYDGQEFEKWYSENRKKQLFPAEYKGFYDQRYIDLKEWKMDALSAQSSERTFEELFNEETGQLQAAINCNRSDLEIAKAIKGKQIEVTSFDFDGVKYSAGEVDSVIAWLEKEIGGQIERQQLLDKEAFVFFSRHSGEGKKYICEKYLLFQSLCLQYDEFVQLGNKIFETTNPFYSGTMTLDEVNSAIVSLKNNYEPALKTKCRQLLEDKMITKERDTELIDSIQNFAGKSYFYFVNKEFMNNELEDLRGLVIKVAETINTRRSEAYKGLLEEQLHWYRPIKNQVLLP